MPIESISSLPGAVANGRAIAARVICHRIQDLVSGTKSSFLANLMAGIIVRLFVGSPHECLVNDVMLEAQAEASYDAREALPRIAVRVWPMGGDWDVYSLEALAPETAHLIPNCTLRLHEAAALAVCWRSGDLYGWGSGKPMVSPHSSMPSRYGT